MKNPPQHLRTLLWEYDIDTLEKNHPTVLERVLSFGDRGDIAYIGTTELSQYFVAKKPKIDKKSHRFWELISGRQVEHTTPSLYEQINTPTSRRNFR